MSALERFFAGLAWVFNWLGKPFFWGELLCLKARVEILTAKAHGTWRWRRKAG